MYFKRAVLQAGAFNSCALETYCHWHSSQCSDQPQKFVFGTGWLKALGVVTTGFGVMSPALEFYRGSCTKHAMKSGWVISWEQDCDSQNKEQSRGLSQSVRNIYEWLKSCPSHSLLMHTSFSGCHFWTRVHIFLWEGRTNGSLLWQVQHVQGGSDAAYLLYCKVVCQSHSQMKLYCIVLQKN